MAAADGMAGPAALEPRRRRHTARWIAVVALVVVAGLVAVLATRPSAQLAEAQSPLLGKPSPPVGGVTVDGARYAVPRVPGHFVVLNFFAGWCTPCQDEGPALVKFAFEHRSGDASLVSVVFDDTVSDARHYQQNVLGATWPTLADASGTLALDFGVSSPPTTFVIAPDGRVIEHIVGEVTAGELDQVIASARAHGV